MDSILTTIFVHSIFCCSVSEFCWKCKQKYVCVITYSVHYCYLTL